MNELLKPFKPEDLKTILKEMESNPVVKEAKAASDGVLFTTTHPLKEAEEHPHFFKREGQYFKSTFIGLHTSFNLWSGTLPKFSPDMMSDLKFPNLVNFEIQKKKYYLPLSEVLSAAETICPLTRVVLSVTEGLSSEEAIKTLMPLLKELSEHILWKKHPDFKKEEIMKDLIKKLKGDDKFVKFWIKEQEIKPEQLTCKHSFMAGYGGGGAVDKKISVCKKCLFKPEQSFDSQECKLTFKGWNAARKAFMA